jgi:putative phosphonate metabolism protein
MKPEALTDSKYARPYRYAVYFAPTSDSAWWSAGSRWLGRCAATGAVLVPPTIPGVSPAVMHDCTADPRRYGWHATLVAPFTLATEQTLASLLSCMRKLAMDLPAFTLPPLRVSTLGDFLALRPEGDLSQVQATAATCVKGLHPLASPLSQAELARRRRAPLTPEQDRLLQAWGYPWVLTQFRFHLSLTGPLSQLEPAVREALVTAAQTQFHALPACRFDSIALFVEPDAGADFEWVDQVALRG